MTRFLDGPAKGQTLMLKRSPILLRVTWDGKKWDALDMIEDTPHPGEKLFAYYITKKEGACHVSTSDKNGRRGGGFYSCAEYTAVPLRDQPPDAVLRDNDGWRAWCIEHAKTLPRMA